MRVIGDQQERLREEEAIRRPEHALRCLKAYGMAPVHIGGDAIPAYGMISALPGSPLGFAG